MFFYCDACGVPVAILNENFTCEVPHHCGQCIELDSMGLLKSCIELPPLAAVQAF